MKNRKFSKNYMFSHPKTEAQIQLNGEYVIVSKKQFDAANKLINSISAEEKAKVDQEPSPANSTDPDGSKTTFWPERGDVVIVDRHEAIYSHYCVSKYKHVVNFPGFGESYVDIRKIRPIEETKKPVERHSEKICLDEIRKWWGSIRKTRRSRNMGPSQRCLAERYFNTNPESLEISHITFIWMQVKHVVHHQV